jgi:hypothetical protein
MGYKVVIQSVQRLYEHPVVVTATKLMLSLLYQDKRKEKKAKQHDLDWLSDEALLFHSLQVGLLSVIFWYLTIF